MSLAGAVCIMEFIQDLPTAIYTLNPTPFPYLFNLYVLTFIKCVNYSLSSLFIISLLLTYYTTMTRLSIINKVEDWQAAKIFLFTLNFFYYSLFF